MDEDYETQYPDLLPKVRRPESSRNYTRLEARFQDIEKRLNFLSVFTYEAVVRDIKVTAGEILKWAIRKRGSPDGHALHYFDQDLACRAYGEYGPAPTQSDLESFKTETQSVIKARNGVAHVNNLEELESMVRSCRAGIKEWPKLSTNYPTQCRIILKYSEFKKLLPESFRDG